jgi:micrococcal nuclease
VGLNYSHIDDMNLSNFRLRCLFVVLACAFLGSCSSSDSSLPQGANARVVKVIDGDTVDISIDGKVERVRLIGIDTPETKKPNTPIECYGPEASQRTTFLLPVGTPVILQRDAEARDHYGRLLGYIFRFSDNLFVNSDLMAGGFARPLAIAPNTTYSEEFSSLATNAQAAKLGLWGAC